MLTQLLGEAGGRARRKTPTSYEYGVPNNYYHVIMPTIEGSQYERSAYMTPFFCPVLLDDKTKVVCLGQRWMGYPTL